jgi:hypothetical protein
MTPTQRAVGELERQRVSPPTPAIPPPIQTARGEAEGHFRSAIVSAISYRMLPTAPVGT